MFNIFDKLGGPQAAVEIIEKRLGWKPTRFTLKHWRAVKQISPRASFALQAECEDRGIEYSQSDFLAPSPSNSSEAA